MSLSIVIPIHNEASRLDGCMQSWLGYLAGKTLTEYEIILVENGSTDATLEKARKWERTVRPGLVRVFSILDRSKALAVRTGMLEARATIVYMADCDLSTPPRELQKFVMAIVGGADVVIGSRRAPGAVVRQSWRRRAVGDVFNLLTGLVLPGIRDTQCGFKAFKLAAAWNLFPQLVTRSMAFDVEILLRARRRGYEIVEVPVEWSENTDSRVRLVKDSWQMARDILRLSRLRA